ncbi:MAG: YggS family pyridoxal phosphate-dependent enzyme [Bacteroidota bacterium]|jgi:pyridoxal phosphate enzyme (YggS family)
MQSETFAQLLSELQPYGAALVAVSKTRSPEEMLPLYDYGQRNFGENYVQELLSKKDCFSGQVNWHFIGHLQSNKVRHIVPFVSLIHGVGSFKVLKEISKRSMEAKLCIDVLLQVHIATEESKSGLSYHECVALYEENLASPLEGIQIRGLMGMASFTDDELQISDEFKGLRKLFDQLRSDGAEGFNILSMGMSSDYKVALAEGSNMVRIGSRLFGPRQ